MLLWISVFFCIVLFYLPFNAFTVDIRVFSFNLILAMDFLNKIGEFATTGLADETPAVISKEEVKSALRTADKSVDTATVSVF